MKIDLDKSAFPHPTALPPLMIWDQEKGQAVPIKEDTLAPGMTVRG